MVQNGGIGVEKVNPAGTGWRILFQFLLSTQLGAKPIPLSSSRLFVRVLDIHSLIFYYMTQHLKNLVVWLEQSPSILVLFLWNVFSRIILMKGKNVKSIDAELCLLLTKKYWTMDTYTTWEKNPTIYLINTYISSKFCMFNNYLLDFITHYVVLNNCMQMLIVKRNQCRRKIFKTTQFMITGHFKISFQCLHFIAKTAQKKKKIAEHKDILW